MDKSNEISINITKALNEEQTICYKVDQCKKIVKKLAKHIDVASLSYYLNEIESDGRRMENNLRLKAEIIHDAGLDKVYQEAKRRIANIPLTY